MSFARLRASPSSSVPTAPSVNLRVLPPKSYCTIHLREPPSRRRTPKPGRSLSKNVLSPIPGGRVSVLMVAVVNRIEAILWAGYGQVGPAASCCLLLSVVWSSTSIISGLQGSCGFVRSYAQVLSLSQILEQRAVPPGALDLLQQRRIERAI